MLQKKKETIEEKNEDAEEKKHLKLAKAKIKKIKKEKTEELIEGKKAVKKEKTSDRSVLIRELKEKAKKLAESIESIDTGKLKEEFEKKRELLIALEDYVRTGIHLGTKVITPDMKKFVYRRRADSIGVLNTTLIDENIKKSIEIISKYAPDEIILVCKRESGWEAAKILENVLGWKVFTKKYPSGMMTNIQLEKFYEPDLVIVCDPWVDHNALNDAIRTNKKVIALCDTNNFTKGVNLVIPCNNKGSKSLGLVFYLIARGYIEKRNIKVKLPSMFSFTGEDLQIVKEIPKEETPKKSSKKEKIELTAI